MTYLPDDFNQVWEEFFGSSQDDDEIEWSVSDLDHTVDGRNEEILDVDEMEKDLETYFKAFVRVGESGVYLDRCIAIENKYYLFGLPPDMVTATLSQMIADTRQCKNGGTK